MSADEAARLLDVSRDTVRRLVYEGKLARVPHMTVIRIPTRALREFAEQDMTTTSTQEAPRWPPFCQRERLECRLVYCP